MTNQQFRIREIISDLRYNYFCRAMKSGLSDIEARAELRKIEVNNSILNVAKAIAQGKILPIMLFYHCFMKINK